MSRKLLISLAIISFALTGTAFSAVENIKVSGDITVQAVNRDLSLRATPSLDQEDFILSQTRLRFDADLTENVGAVIGLINERLWGDEDATNEDSNIDLDLGYIEMKDVLDYPLTLIIGRQNLRYGNALIVGDPDTNQNAATSEVPQAMRDLSLRKSFDAFRAIFDYSPYTLDLIYSKISEGGSSISEDYDLFGANLAYDWQNRNGVTEVYLFGTKGLANTSTPQGREYIMAVGSRVQFDASDRLTLSGEAAYEFGDAAVDNNNSPASAEQFQSLRAWAAQLIGTYKFLNKYNCVVNLSYTYLSGDNDYGDKYHNAWQPMFEDQTPSEIINLVASSTNIHFITLGGTMMPREDITLGLLYAKAIFAEKFGFSTYTPAVGPASSNTYTVNRDEADIGDEVNLSAVYDYTEDVQAKLVGAYFMPGDFFTKDNENDAYSIRGSLTVSF